MLGATGLGTTCPGVALGGVLGAMGRPSMWMRS